MNFVPQAGVVRLGEPNQYIAQLKMKDTTHLWLIRADEAFKAGEFDDDQIRDLKTTILERCTQWFSDRDEAYRLKLLDLVETMGLVELTPQLVGFLRWELSERVRDRVGQVIVSLTRSAPVGSGAMDEWGLEVLGEVETAAVAELEEELERSREALRKNLEAYENQPPQWREENEGKYATFFKGEPMHLAGSMDKAVAWERANLGPGVPDCLTIQVRKPSA